MKELADKLTDILNQYYIWQTLEKYKENLLSENPDFTLENVKYIKLDIEEEYDDQGSTYKYVDNVIALDSNKEAIDCFVDSDIYWEFKDSIPETVVNNPNCAGVHIPFDVNFNLKEKIKEIL